MSTKPTIESWMLLLSIESPALEQDAEFLVIDRGGRGANCDQLPFGDQYEILIPD